MKELFIDDHIVEAIDNLARKLHQPHKFRHNVVLRAEHRSEGGVSVVLKPPKMGSTARKRCWASTTMMPHVDR